MPPTNSSAISIQQQPRAERAMADAAAQRAGGAVAPVEQQELERRAAMPAGTPASAASIGRCRPRSAPPPATTMLASAIVVGQQSRPRRAAIAAASRRRRRRTTPRDSRPRTAPSKPDRPPAAGALAGDAAISRVTGAALGSIIATIITAHIDEDDEPVAERPFAAASPSSGRRPCPSSPSRCRRRAADRPRRAATTKPRLASTTARSWRSAARSQSAVIDAGRDYVDDALCC